MEKFLKRLNIRVFQLVKGVRNLLLTNGCMNIAAGASSGIEDAE